MMTTAEALQLGVAVLFPLSLMMVLLATAAGQRGRTRREITLGLFAIAACVGGVVVIGLGLSWLRGAPLFDFGGRSFSFGALETRDVIGLLLCAVLLVTALRVSKWLTRGSTPPTDSEPQQQ
jgi:hypothetical protein